MATNPVLAKIQAGAAIINVTNAGGLEDMPE